ncbi:DmpA family aminopeptidase [Anaeromicrobium sediminis]|uniref:Aminopeptidase n=1 Tax=Anaeromicrobium sediminis TaxID=1478221 RepID=A0A267MJ50_9FIRM|nr:P1 family peptidase [Anaeromicrobium sediminis]PAB59556.1 aminopeptidase [Anaeromicrobium sediminis]
MTVNKRIRDYEINIGRLKPGKNNLITDVLGVKVGNYTLNDDHIQTGVTAIVPHEGNLFKEKLVAATYVINGFGKSTGLMQINELGTLETPIILTNTLSVGIGFDSLVKYMLRENEDIGVSTGTINPIVCECNDGYLNDIRGGYITEKHVIGALEKADELFEEGSVGAGRGMSAYKLKGGIGSSSRVFMLGHMEYTIGALVLSNMGEKRDLTIEGYNVGEKIYELEKSQEDGDKGSIIMIIATDVPLSSRQLRRICKRAGVGLSKTGSLFGNGSGDIVIGFSTANKIHHYEKDHIVDIKVINEDKIDILFRACAESVEEAIINSMICAETVKGRDGNYREGLRNYMDFMK